MRLMAAALALSLTLAVVAAVFALWPVVADAPWEDEATRAVTDRTDELRCEAALELRRIFIEWGLEGNLAGATELPAFVQHAEGDISRYC